MSPVRLYRLMTADDVRTTLNRMADEILERNRGREIVLLGIQRRGVPMARRIATRIGETQTTPLLGTLDINLYRDDLKVSHRAQVHPTDLPIDIDGKDVILVDDVLYTGRSVRAALDAVSDFGRMRTIQLAVMVDRGHRELPIAPNYVGREIVTADNELVDVRLVEIDGEDAVDVVEKP